MQQATAPRQHDFIARYFEEFLPSLAGRLLIEDLRDLTTCFEVVVSDADPKAWRISVERGRLVGIGRDGPPPVCCFRTDLATMREMAAARIAPADAFFDLRVEVDGDVEQALKLSTVLEPFFRSFPFAG